MAPEITVSGLDGKISNWQALDKKLMTFPDVKRWLRMSVLRAC
ncbi:hypothetical protein [Legionella taurinensis]|nr:hypothetical protein [Legionella taurinensis]